MVLVTRGAVQGRGRRRLRGKASVRRFICRTATSYTLMLLAFMLRHEALMSYDSSSIQSDRLYQRWHLTACFFHRCASLLIRSYSFMAID